MILASVISLSTFPFEKLGIFLNNTAAPEASARFGIRWRNHYYDGGDKLLNWDTTLSLKQGGLEPALLTNTTYSGFYIPANNKQFFQPFSFVGIPDDFPVFHTASAYPYNDVFLNFKGGLSSATVFPSRPYPKLTKVSENQFSVSACLLPVSAFNENLLRDDYYKRVDTNNLQNLQSNRGRVLLPSHTFAGPVTTVNMFPDIFYSSHKKDFVWKTITSNPLINIAFNNSIMPANPPSNPGIIPDSFSVSFQISSLSSVYPYNYYMSYANTLTAGAIHSLSSLDIEQFVTKPIIRLAQLDSANAKLYIELNTGYTVPKDTNVTINYETSSLAYIKSATGSVFRQGASANNPSTNNFSISTENPPYLYNYRFTLSSLALPSRNAFTVNFAPSSFLVPTGVTSAFDVSTIFVDNYFQMNYPILNNIRTVAMKFEEETGDVTLSAIDRGTDIVYVANDWMPASATARFINNGFANSHTVNITVSTVSDAVFHVAPLTFILNKDQAVMNLAITEFTESSAFVEGTIYPNYDPDLFVVWNVSPPENISLIEPFTERVIPLGTPVEAGLLQVQVSNLGVDNTRISLYSQEFDVSASTIWFPPTAIYQNVSFIISGGIDDNNRIKTGTLSGLFQKQGLLYPAPENANITWSEVNNDVRGSIDFRSREGVSFIENSIQPSTRSYTNINPELSTRIVDSNPQTIVFDIRANIFSNLFNLNAGKLIFAREYPSVTLFAYLSTYDEFMSLDRIVDTSQTESVFYITSADIFASAVLNNFVPISGEQVSWTFSNGNPTITGVDVNFQLLSSACITLSAVSARPIFGGFGYYNFSDEICIFILDAPPPIFDYVAFPEYQFFPTEHLLTTDGTYLNSRGLTGLDVCGSQNFTISANPGFSEYVYKIGDKVTRSFSNIETIPVTFGDISATGVLSVSAFSDLFVETDPGTVYNAKYSDNSSVFLSDISFVTFPDLEAQLSVTNDLFDIRRPFTTFFNTAINFVYSDAAVNSYTFVYVLSSDLGVTISEEVEGTGNVNNLFTQFTLNPADFFHISKNSFTVFNYYVSGNLVKNVPNYTKSCTQAQAFSSNIVVLSAYDGPDLEIFTERHVYSVNEIVEITNVTSDDYPELISTFELDLGNGNIPFIPYGATVQTSYASEGLYTLSMTATYPDGATLTRVWPDFILIKDNFENYNSAIVREFPDTLEFPYSCDDIKIKPNEWQHASTLNKAFDKLRTNYDFLTSMSFTYDIKTPKVFIGWLAEQDDALTWHYDEEYPLVREYSDVFGVLKDINIQNNKFFLINDNKIEIHDNDFEFTTLYSSANITEGEIFIDPVGIVYNSVLNKTIVLDKAKKSVFVFDVSDAFDSLALTHYWGGVGEKSSRTKLNNPTDIKIDQDGQLYIVDADSLVVKIYNKFLNWINNIEYSGWTSTNYPVSITIKDSKKYILTSTNLVYVFDEENEYVRNFSVNAGNKIVSADLEDGLIYIIGGQVYVYTVDGLYINAFHLPKDGTAIKTLSFANNEIYALNDFSVYNLIDYTQTSSIKANLFDANIWSWDAIRIKDDELVTGIPFNDSFFKLHNNLTMLGYDLTGKFVVYIDEFDQYISQTVSAILPTEQLLSATSFVPLGLNEIVSYDTINRMFDNVCYDYNLALEMIQVKEERFAPGDICWTWDALSLTQLQNLNPNRNPFSWYELTSEIKPHIGLSAIIWDTAKTCNAFTNHSPFCWTWAFLSCCQGGSVIEITWADMECGAIYGRTWADLEDNCCENPTIYFDDCVDLC